MRFDLGSWVAPGYVSGAKGVEGGAPTVSQWLGWSWTDGSLEGEAVDCTSSKICELDSWCSRDEGDESHEAEHDCANGRHGEGAGTSLTWD